MGLWGSIVSRVRRARSQPPSISLVACASRRRQDRCDEVSQKSGRRPRSSPRVSLLCPASRAAGGTYGHCGGPWRHRRSPAELMPAPPGRMSAMPAPMASPGVAAIPPPRLIGDGPKATHVAVAKATSGGGTVAPPALFPPDVRPAAAARSDRSSGRPIGHGADLSVPPGSSTPASTKASGLTADSMGDYGPAPAPGASDPLQDDPSARIGSWVDASGGRGTPASG